MEILFNSLKSILNDKLSLTERGILITILLCKSSDKRITLAKFKTTCKISLIKKELVSLQDQKFIKWSGYKTAKKSLENDEYAIQRSDVMDFMNNLYGRKFRKDTSTVLTNLTARLKEYGEQEVKLVIANRYKEWKDDSFMNKYLKPETIFKKSKFDSYVEEALKTRVGESFVASSNINLKDGDEITLEISETLIDNDTYNIKIYQCDGEGKRRSNGVKASRYGKDIKKSLKLQKLVPIREHRYYYSQN